MNIDYDEDVNDNDWLVTRNTFTDVRLSISQKSNQNLVATNASSLNLNEDFTVAKFRPRLLERS